MASSSCTPQDAALTRWRQTKGVALACDRKSTLAIGPEKLSHVVGGAGPCHAASLLIHRLFHLSFCVAVVLSSMPFGLLDVSVACVCLSFIHSCVCMFEPLLWPKLPLFSLLPCPVVVFHFGILHFPQCCHEFRPGGLLCLLVIVCDCFGLIVSIHVLWLFVIVCVCLVCLILFGCQYSCLRLFANVCDRFCVCICVRARVRLSVCAFARVCACSCDYLGIQRLLIIHDWILFCIIGCELVVTCNFGNIQTANCRLASR